MSGEAGFYSSRHILIYGPTAAGKLSVASELCEATGFRLLDNMLTVAIGKRLFTFGTPQFRELVEALRLEMAMAAARARLDVVSTLMYGASDAGFVEELGALVREHGGQFYVVRLMPRAEALERRVADPGRRAFDKVANFDASWEILRRRQASAVINSTDLAIDNSDLHPSDVAREIRVKLMI